MIGGYVRDFRVVAGESTCLKRVTVCQLLERHAPDNSYDRDWWLIVASESNRCEPPGGVCSRLGKRDGQSDYPSESPCNWTHAEIRALAAIPTGTNPTRAIIYGHDFPCPDCERALRAAGITDIEIGHDEELAPHVGIRR